MDTMSPRPQCHIPSIHQCQQNQEKRPQKRQIGIPESKVKIIISLYLGAFPTSIFQYVDTGVIYT